MPKPKAKPCHSSGSMPQLASTFGCTMPQPPSSSHEPSGRWMSNSADGSVNGKYDGRSREREVAAEEGLGEGVDACRPGRRR